MIPYPNDIEHSNKGEVSPASIPTKQSSIRRKQERDNMNLSRSEHNNNHSSSAGSSQDPTITYDESKAVMGRLEPTSSSSSDIIPRSPTKMIMKRLMPGSWHGEKGRSSSSSSSSPSKKDNTSSNFIIPTAPLSSPSDSGSSRRSRSGDTSSGGSLRRSRTLFSSNRKLIPSTAAAAAAAPPQHQESPGSSHSTIKRILSPNILSPSVPGQMTPATNDGKGMVKVAGPLSSLPMLVPPTPDLMANNNKKRSPSLLDKISTTGTSLIKEVAVPSLYKYARKCMWEDFARCLERSGSSTATHDIGYVYKKDGTTVMHMVVMSGTGYINAFKSSSKDFSVAPLDLLEKLLQMNPEVAKVPCSLNGYTPLTYACLVCNNKYDVENAAAMVRLFLNYCPESIEIFTKDGLSPLDIHVVSYSHHHPEKEDASSLGRTSASVLRTLLTHSPELAQNRLQGDKIKGPIELLYKCNSKAFSQAVMDEIYDGADEEGTVKSDFTIPERRQKVVDTVKKWWIWTWAVMILKYGSLKQKKRGAQFAAVHAAAMQMGCPTPILSITLYAFPRQIKQPILDKDDLENLPLHAVCSWPSGPSHKSATQSLLATRKSQAISRVIEEYPLAIKVTNGNGETALELAAKTGTTWDGGVRRLVKAYPKALRSQSKRTGLYPFMTAAAAAEPSQLEEREAQSVRTIYGLLRSNPKVLTQAWQQSGQR